MPLDKIQIDIKTLTSIPTIFKEYLESKSAPCRESEITAMIEYVQNGTFSVPAPPRIRNFITIKDNKKVKLTHKNRRKSTLINPQKCQQEQNTALIIEKQLISDWWRKIILEHILTTYGEDNYSKLKSKTPKHIKKYFKLVTTKQYDYSCQEIVSDLKQVTKSVSYFDRASKNFLKDLRSKLFMSLDTKTAEELKKNDKRYKALVLKRAYNKCTSATEMKDIITLNEIVNGAIDVQDTEFHIWIERTFVFELLKIMKSHVDKRRKNGISICYDAKPATYVHEATQWLLAFYQYAESRYREEDKKSLHKKLLDAQFPKAHQSTFSYLVNIIENTDIDALRDVMVLFAEYIQTIMDNEGEVVGKQYSIKLCKTAGRYDRSFRFTRSNEDMTDISTLLYQDASTHESRRRLLMGIDNLYGRYQPKQNLACR